MTDTHQPSVLIADILLTQREILLKSWHQELSQNKHFSKENLKQLEGLEHHCQDLFKDIISTFRHNNDELFLPEGLDYILQLWRKILSKHLKKGLGTRNMALLIFALKSSVLRTLSADLDPATGEALTKLDRLLNILGMLSFEFYTAEKESQILQQQGQINYLQNEKTMHLGKLIGNSPQMKAVYDAIGMILENDITVLLEGESGTGKDLIASTIHHNSTRKEKPFVVVNCGAIPKELVESELFGHEKGAFTGADNQKIGKFELANTGTLFLDEIGELPLDMQVKLLRVIQNREVQRVGGTQDIPIDIRIIAATNKSLKEQVSMGHFRLDLFYRLNIYPIKVPPLRERGKDILLIAIHFLDKYAEQFHVPPKKLSHDAEHFLLQHPWEGNIRELENLMQRALIVSKDTTIFRSVLEFEPGQMTSTTALLPPSITSTEIATLDQVEKQAISVALKATKGNIKKTASALGISRTTLYNKMKKYNIDETDT